MRWSYLHKVYGQLMSGAILAVFFVPMLADSMREFGINYEYLRVPISGGVIFLLCFMLFKGFCPALIAKYKTLSDYSTWAVSENVNAFDEFKVALSKSEEYFKKSLGDKFDIFYPIDRGLTNSRKDCIKEYAAIEYQLIDKSNPVLLYLMVGFSSLSIVMINWLSLGRLYRILGG